MSEFDDATAVEPDGTTAIRPGWDIGGNANGGYLLALVANGLRRLADRPDPITVTGHFLAPGTAGPATVTGRVVKAGRRYVTTTGALERDGKPLLQVLATFGEAGDPDTGFTYATGAPPDLPPMEECIARGPVQGAVPVPLRDKVSLRLRPTDAGFADGVKTGVAEVAGWFAFVDGRPIDTLALLLAGDAFPPAVFNIDVPPGWAPTLEYTVQVRAVPDPGPLRCLFRTRFVAGGHFEEDGELWDSAGRLVALSRQLALIGR